MKIEIFSTPQCAYCDAAKKLLDDKGLAYTNLDVMSDPAILADFKRRLPRVKAVPQIFIDGEHIGGYEDLRRRDHTGRLQR
ncbi:MAG: glutaredoxin domain-containing protein [Alphaproteobacteria bacterium]|nr:glutaredoxin domain-containing protein [Alphaproteobacteria bacterium]MCZ6510826.1 glutaredoxin domain-containing protein [Alphaproteobacteria bacterium]MCZ6839793.1 glutaredoxin domain-containing protein [Alphaproteobacteria bacterium]